QRILFAHGRQAPPCDTPCGPPPRIAVGIYSVARDTVTLLRSASLPRAVSSPGLLSWAPTSRTAYFLVTTERNANRTIGYLASLDLDTAHLRNFGVTASPRIASRGGEW